MNDPISANTNRPELDKSALSISRMFSNISSRYDITNTLSSLGLHYIWKKKAFALIPPFVTFDKAVDLCTGTGALIPELQKLASQIVAVDFSAGMLERARNEFGKDSSISFIQGDVCAENVLQSNHFDIATVAYGMRNFSSLSKGIRNIRDSLKKGGFLLVIEFGIDKTCPPPEYVRFYNKHILPVIGLLLTRNRAAYQYLQKSIEDFPAGSEMGEVVEKCGFSTVATKRLWPGICHAYLFEAV